MSFITIWNLSFITITWVFEFHVNLTFWVLSQFEFLSFIKIWVFKFEHNFEFLNLLVKFFCYCENQISCDFYCFVLRKMCSIQQNYCIFYNENNNNTEIVKEEPNQFPNRLYSQAITFCLGKHPYVHCAVSTMAKLAGGGSVVNWLKEG